MKLSLPLLELVAVVLVLATALFLRLAPISSESVDGDELFSRRVALSQTPQALNLVRQDLVHPPLYYLLLKVTLPNGRPASAMDIRILSLTFGTASTIVLILVGVVKTQLRRPSTLAACLLALNKEHSFYSQEARSYALFTFLVGALFLWCLFMERQEHEWTYWVVGASLMISLLYTHYYGAFYCAAVVIPIAFGNFPSALKIKALITSALAFATFLPWVWLEAIVYREKAGFSSNLAWQGLPTLFDLKMTFANYLGIPNFRGATSLVFLIETVLICVALLPSFRGVKALNALDSRTRATLASMALAPPVLAFLLTKWPFHLPIFDERHVLPSIVAFLLLVSYGLWRLTLDALRRFQISAFLLGVIILAGFSGLPVYSDWPGPSREPYAAMANWLSHTDLDFPVYTTWPYGIGEPVDFYCERGRHVDAFPTDPAKLPARCIVLYRPAAPQEDAAVASLSGRFDIIEEKYYSARNSRWGTNVRVLQKRAVSGFHWPERPEITHN